MRIEVEMPQMGESIVEGTIVEWLKAVGDSVKRDEDIFTLSTDKVDAEVPSPEDGVLVAIHAAVGDTVEVGTVVAVLETDPAAAGAGRSSQDVDASDTPTEEPAAPSAPVAPSAPSAAAKSTAPDTASDRAATPVSDGRPHRSTPVVRRMAAAHGITDLSSITGTGAGGRVTKKDLERRLAADGANRKSDTPKGAAPKSTPAPPSTAVASAAALGIPRGYEPALARVPRVHVYDNDTVTEMSRMRASIAENMLQSRRTAAHCATVWEADVTNIVRVRDSLKKDFAARDIKLTLTPFFVQAVVAALREHPMLNAAIDGTRIVTRGSVNIGLASALDDGLIVPVIKGADSLNLSGIAQAVNDLNRRSKSGELRPSDVSDGTFTITNSGVFGSLYGVPILIPPQVAILNIGGIKKRVVADNDDNIRIRSMAHLCLSFDHRLIDGRSADQFMGSIVNYLATATGG